MNGGCKSNHLILLLGGLNKITNTKHLAQSLTGNIAQSFVGFFWGVVGVILGKTESLSIFSSDKDNDATLPKLS